MLTLQSLEIETFSSKTTRNLQEQQELTFSCKTPVSLPPNIDDSLSSSDVIVREGSNISLRCRATGSPKPIIKWKRDDNSRITISKNRIVNDWEGDTLEITRISRLDMGAYLCIASNGVPPTVSKRIKVSVDCKYLSNFNFHLLMRNPYLVNSANGQMESNDALSNFISAIKTLPRIVWPFVRPKQSHSY
uniref:Ig-like domain-containing protein n=1 Tax=Glossina pallidipes TaxID=7398 RepID=A0A1B0A4Z4_GLOPL